MYQSINQDVRGTQLSRRVIYALLRPAVQIAHAFRVPIKELGELAQLAYFHETRRRGLKLREASEVLDVSMRKVALLSKRLKSAFLAGEVDVALPRRIEFMLWGEPLSEARIAQALPTVDPDEITEALALLVVEGRIEFQPGRTGRYAVVRSEFVLVEQRGWLSRIDGLNNLLSSVSNAVHGRFFKDEGRAFARTISLRVRKGQVGALQALYDEVIYPRLLALDAEAKGKDDAEAMDLSIVWAPYEYLESDVIGGGEQ